MEESFSLQKIPLYIKQVFFYDLQKKIKYYEIFLLEKKKSQPIQFLHHNFTTFPIFFLFSLKDLLQLGSRM